MSELINTIRTSLDSLREAQNDIAKLEQLSNQFRTCFLVVVAPPSQTIAPNGGNEIHDFMEQKRSLYENNNLEENIAIIDALQAHLALFSRLAREQSKIKVKLDVESRLSEDKNATSNIRAKKAAKLDGKIHVDASGDEVKNPATAGIEPIDKKTHKAIQQIKKTLNCSYEDARKMVMGLQVKK